MVPGVTDDIYALLSPTFSVFGPMGINPNLADEGALKSLHKTINDDVVAKIMNRRTDPQQEGPFKDAEDFFNFVTREGANISQEEQDKIPLRFNDVLPCNFRIQSTGSSGKTPITLTALTYDIACAQTQVCGAMMDEQSKKSGGTASTKDQCANKQAPKGPPRIVYWNEK
jgi:hypothetical protein